MKERVVSITYSRTTSFDQEELEDELVVMELGGQSIVALNATGQMVWAALEDGATFDELEAIFLEAFHEVDPAILRRDIQAVLDTLLTANLAVADGDAS